MKLKLFLYVGLPVLLCIISGISMKYYAMVTTIEKQEKKIEELKNHKVVLEVDLQTEKHNVEILSGTIKELNGEITKMEIKNQRTIQAYNDLMKKNSKELYINKEIKDLMHSDIWNREDGEACLELNRQISKLKYDDL